MTTRLTVAQALVRFLANQHAERDGRRQRLIAGCFGIFGHGNLAELGQALRQYPDELSYHQCRNEQAMVHTAAAYARMTDRMSTFACTASVGPGSTNMVTAAAGATINRLPVLLLPGDVFATRVADPVLQQLELPYAADVSVNDCFRPVSRYFDRITRPEQLIGSALQAMRVLTDPVETGAVTLALPQDVQAEAFDWPEEFLAPRVWPVRRPLPEVEPIAEAARLIRAAARSLIVAGGGVIYAQATAELADLAGATGLPVAETQAGKGALRFDHPASVGAIGVTGSVAANALAAEADLVLGVGTRYSDFTTGSMPGDLHKLWRAAHPKQYHVEYGYSCMGYEIAGGLGVKLAAPEREVFVLVGDGSYLMMAQELVTAVAEGIKLIVVPGAEPRLRLHRRAVGHRRCQPVRHLVPLPRPADRAVRRRKAADRPRGRRGQSWRGHRRRQLDRRAAARPRPRDQVRPDHSHPGRNRSARAGPRLRRLVGRAGRRGLRHPGHRGRRAGVPAGEARAAPPSVRK
jgi:TPP-dependent trihydroxycyclohexane-1,2-dione (THcHDO) dehydratase